VIDSSWVPGNGLGHRLWDDLKQPRLEGTQTPRRSPLRVTTYLRSEVYCDFHEVS